MDWTIIATIVVAGWACLSVIGGERQRRLQELQSLKTSSVAGKAAKV